MEDPRRQHDRVSRLHKFFARLVCIAHADSLAVLVHYAPHIAMRARREILLLLQNRKQSAAGTGLGTHHAREERAVTAVLTRRAVHTFRSGVRMACGRGW